MEKISLSSIFAIFINKTSRKSLYFGVSYFIENPEDKSNEKMRNVIKNMIGNLTEELNKVDSHIGSKLYLLDKDKDGVITVDELQQAIEAVLKVCFIVLSCFSNYWCWLL